MKHILNNLTDKEKQSILEQHKGGMKVVNENFSKLIKATLGDVKPLVSEQADDQNTHRYDVGEQSPGIEKFLTNPNDETISNGLLNELRNDPYGKGKIVIIFNGEKFKEPGSFMYKIQTDFKAGKCYEITNYTYNNRFIINTQIKITAKSVECKKTTEPIKTSGGTTPIKISGGTTPIKISGGTGNDQPKVKCRYKIVVPRRPKTYNGGVSEGSAPGEPYDSEWIRGFQEFCSRKGLWKKDLNNGTTVPCTSKLIDGKWGCCSQTCFNTLKKRKSIPRPIPGDDVGYRGDAEPSKNIPGSDCPKSVNCMPGPGQRDSICKNTKVLEMCKRLGTKVYY